MTPAGGLPTIDVYPSPFWGLKSGVRLSAVLRGPLAAPQFLSC